MPANLPEHSPAAILRTVLSIIQQTNPDRPDDGLRTLSGADVVECLGELEFPIRAALASATPDTDRYDAWDDSFARTIIRHEGTETRYVPVVDRHLPFAVGQIPDDSNEMESLQRKHDGDLLNGVPSLALTTPGDIRHALTWEEAYNLGAALIDVALVSLHG